MFQRLSRVFRVVHLCILATSLAIAISGCGGGGGGGASTGSLVYTTSWTADRSDPASGSGASQLIALLDSNENVVHSVVLNRGSGNAVTLPDLTSTSYLLRSELYSQADATGTKLGQVTSWVTISGATTFATEVGGAVDRVRVTPSQATIPVEHSKQFYASAVSVAGLAVFTETGAFRWDVLGGIGTTSTNGLMLGTTPGAGSIRATHIASGALGSSPVTVSEFNARRGKWTILVFLNAANDLYRYSDPNVNQMERVAGNPDVRFVLQWKQSQSTFAGSSFDGTRRYLVAPDTSTTIKSEVIQDLGDGVDMGSAQTLSDFIVWGKKNFPADRYALVVWNHGSGWNRSESAATRAVSYDDELGTVIQVWELRHALANQHLDVIAWDASLMQMLEIAYEMKDHADYVVGSEESPPGEGYPYDLIFREFRDKPDLDTRSLTKNFVDGMVNYPPYTTRKITQSVIETSKLDAVASSLDVLAGELIAHRADLGAIVTNARDTAQSFSPSSLRYYRDLRDVLQVMKASGGLSQSLYDAATAVQVAATQATAWEGHNANSPKSTGIAIDFTPGSRFSSFSSDYRQLQIAAATRWDEWLLVSP